MPEPDTAAGGSHCPTCAGSVVRLSRRLEREKAARLEAERTAENGLRDLYRAKRDLDLLCQITAQANTASTAEEIVGPAINAFLDASGWPLG